MTIQTKLRINEITLNNNICFPVGNILAVKKQYEKLGLSKLVHTANAAPISLITTSIQLLKS